MTKLALCSSPLAVLSLFLALTLMNLYIVQEFLAVLLLLAASTATILGFAGCSSFISRRDTPGFSSGENQCRASSRLEP